NVLYRMVRLNRLIFKHYLLVCPLSQRDVAHFFTSSVWSDLLRSHRSCPYSRYVFFLLERRRRKMNQAKLSQKLIITIVKKEKAKKVISQSKAAGANGGTVVLGTGFRFEDKSRFLGIPIKREREIILTIVPNAIFLDVMARIIHSVNLNRPKQGIGFVIDLKKVTGMNHDLNITEDSNKSYNEVKSKLTEQNMTYDLIVTIVNQGDSDKVVEA